LLFGDWGTSRLYVLGLAFFYTAHASVPYLAAMSLLMTAVAWAYTVICRCFPEGGGVYTAARRLSPLLSVVGATLLVCDYTVTASLSTLEAFHYFGCPPGQGHWIILTVSVITIGCLGLVNWLGARTAGRLALLIAFLSLVISVTLGIACIRLLPDGIRAISAGPPQPAFDRWQSFVHIVLALSGVEAVANMTGLFREPVARTAKKTIWPVLIEVATFNLLFGIAFTGLPQLLAVTTPDAVTIAQGGTPVLPPEYRDTAMKVLATHATNPLIGSIAGWVFGLLLLSASNTAIVAIVSVLYAMAQDRELPRPLTRLNYSGVPWIPLVIAVLMPAVVLVVERDVQHLAELYAIGVCGAITINILSCAFNRELPIKIWERRGLFALGALLLAVELTIIVTKLNATIFAGAIVGVVLGARFLALTKSKYMPTPLPEPTTGWLAEVQRAPAEIDPSKPKIMLAARGRNQAEYAVDLARRRGATLFAIHVRTLRVLDVAPGQVPRIENDPEALQGLGSVAMLAREASVPFVPIYVSSTDIAEEILDYTATFGCDTLIMGKSTRLAFTRALEGDVVSRVARALPEGISLVLREGSRAMVVDPGQVAKPEQS